jgi:hypothetical protein
MMKYKIIGHTKDFKDLRPQWIEAPDHKTAMAEYKKRTNAHVVYLETTEEGIEKPPLE